MKKFPMEHRIKRDHIYTSSVATDIRKTIARARKQLAAQTVRALPALDVPVVAAAPESHVVPMRKRGGK